MKVIFLFIAIYASISSIAQTTSDEYDYITIGYENQIKHGLSGKKGYHFKKIQNYNLKYNENKEINFIFSKLIKEENKKGVAIMIEYKSRDTSGVKIDYFCIPHINSKKAIWDSAYGQKIFKTNNIELLRAYSLAVTKFASEISN